MTHEALTASRPVQMRDVRQLMESQPQAGRVPLSKFVTRRHEMIAEPLLLTERIADTDMLHGRNATKDGFFCCSQKYRALKRSICLFLSINARS